MAGRQGREQPKRRPVWRTTFPILVQVSRLRCVIALPEMLLHILNTHTPKVS